VYQRIYAGGNGNENGSGGSSEKDDWEKRIREKEE